MKWFLLLLIASAAETKAQIVTKGRSSTNLLELRAFVESHREPFSDCVYDSVFGGKEARVGCYVVYFTKKPCHREGHSEDDTTQEQTHCNFLFVQKDGAFVSVPVDTLDPEGPLPEPIAFRSFRKESQAGFVILYRWPQNLGAGIVGAFYQAVVYKFTPGATPIITKNNQLFKNEYDGVAMDGRRTKAKYKTIQAVMKKIASAKL